MHFQLTLRPNLLLSIYLYLTSKAEFCSFMSKGIFSVISKEALTTPRQESTKNIL